MSRSSRPLWVALGLVFAAWVVLWGWRSFAGATDAVPWRQDAEAALTDSTRPVLLHFTADWCPPCQQMKANVYSDEAFAAWLDANVVPVKVDLTAPGAAEQALATRFQVQHIPTLVLLGSDGIVLTRISGYIARDALQGAIADALAANAPDVTASAARPWDAAAHRSGPLAARAPGDLHDFTAPLPR